MGTLSSMYTYIQPLHVIISIAVCWQDQPPAGLSKIHERQPQSQ